MKMSKQEFDLRVASIDEQWEARRKEIYEYHKQDRKSRKIVEAADDWHGQQWARLMQESGWTMDEIGAWIAENVIKKLEHAKAECPPLGLSDKRKPLKKVGISKVRSALAEYFQAKAESRQSRAKKKGAKKLQQLHHRNQRSADALKKVAAYIEDLPGEDSLLQLFARSPMLFDGGFFLPPGCKFVIGYSENDSESDRQAFKCGFDDPIIDDAEKAAEWFASWVKTVASEAGESWLESEE